MSKSIVFMYSGQGSQYFHMAEELFENQPVFRKWMLELDNQVKRLVGKSIIERIYDKSKGYHDIFDELTITHPAIFMVEYSLSKVFMERGIYPDFVLGTSMGEFASLAVSEVLPVEEVLKCLLEQASIIEKHLTSDGGMLTVLGNPAIYYEDPIVHSNCELAALNFDTHFVVAGKRANLQIISEYLHKSGVSSISLPVRYAFHSSMIDKAGSLYKEFLKNKFFSKPAIPLISCINGALTESIPYTYLWDISRMPIQFKKSIEFLEVCGSHIYVDMSPSGTLANFTKYNIKNSSTSEILQVLVPYYQKPGNIIHIFEKLEKYKIKRGKKMSGKMLAYVFPGQGSQEKGMGAELFDKYRELTAKADEILGYSIKELCLNDPDNILGNTRYTQPALYVVNALSYLDKIESSGVKPDFVAGHSLGEYNALFASGVFDFETGLRLVKKRGELMSEAIGGGMAAVIGFNEEQVKEVLNKYQLTEIDIANYNAPTQIVISGKKEDIEKAQPYFEAEGVKRYVVLKVSGAFHSRYMRTSLEQFSQFVDQLDFAEPSIPVISNVYARPYKNNSIKATLMEQIVKSVKWTESIRYLMGKGEIEIVQVGPGNVLTSLVRTIQREAQPLVVEENEETDDMPQPESQLKNDPVSSPYNPVKDEKTGSEIGNMPQNNQNPQNSTLKSQSERDNRVITPESLGDSEFKKDYNLKYAYLVGGMYRGITSKEMVVRLAKSGMMGFLGTGGMELEQVERDIVYLKSKLKEGEPFGVNLLYDPNKTQKEFALVELFFKQGITNVEAAAYMSITAPLVWYRLKGLKMSSQNRPAALNRIMAKVSRPEVAEAFLSPPPERIVEKLLDEGKITRQEAELSKYIPMADDICVESDSGGHTDQGVSTVLIPAMIKLRDMICQKFNYSKRVRVGAAGGIGTPEAAASAFVMGAGFILTGSINQCTVEAGTSDVVKDMLQQINIQDCEYAPAGDMFELGARVQVLKRGVFFPARANKLYELYKYCESIDDIDEKTKKQIQEKYFRKSFDEVYNIVKEYQGREDIERAERNPKHKMALIFKWYFSYATKAAFEGNEEHKVNFQIHTGPALGAFNQWVKGTSLESWRNRHSEEIGLKIISGASELLNKWFY